ncbi:acetylcholinesterase-like [Patiria miniata]|uniref:Carboxylesterase type B domain-containing protein n=1 Tax=Patiria miniata TaxID=46514 RepID=A0A913ZSX6_PATMI|nr:acetylcholinesterase-like [Patiria miniata]
MAILISLLVLISPVASAVYGDSVVRTTAGKVLGMELEANGTAHRVFAGIPYAEPPVRFSAPVAKTPWGENGAFNATAFGPACPQDVARLTAFAPDWVRIPDPAMEISEDCLTLNVYTPVIGNDTSNPLAVMVWFHGGSYRNGLGSVYDASQLALKGDVVVVTMNYRLGPFGFLYTGDENAPGNVGLMDQQLALRWVQDNIHAFGGDPSRVTLFGQSDVHGSPTVHMFAKASRSLFHRMAAHSGVMQSEDLLESSRAIEDAKLFAQFANCPSKSSGPLVECLRGKTVKEIVDSYEPFFSQRKKTSFAWRPVFTRDFFALTGDSLSYDLLSVFNSGDGSVALELIKDLYPGILLSNGATEEQLKQWLDVNIDKPDVIDIAVERQYIEIDTMNDSVARMKGLFNIQLDRTLYQYGVQALRDLRSMLSSSRLMIFDYRTSTETRFPDPYGLVPHGEELPYVFGLPHDESWGLGAQFTDEERMLSLCMIRYWSNFAKTGDPNNNEGEDASSASNNTWPEYGENEKYLLTKLSTETVGERYRSEGVSFWREYLKELEAAVEEACPAQPRPTQERCEKQVIGEGLGLALTPQQTDTLIESFMFIVVALLCLCVILVGVACGYKYRRRAVSSLHYQSMASEEGVVNEATGMGLLNRGFRRDEESPGTSGSSSPDPVGEQAAPLPKKHLEDDIPENRDTRRSHVTFSQVYNEEEDVQQMFPPPPDDLDDGDDPPVDSIDQEEGLPPPPEEDGDDDVPPPPDELEELNLSDEFRMPEEVASSSPATTGNEDDDGSLASDPDSNEPPADEGGSRVSDPADTPVNLEPAHDPLDDFHSLNRRQSDNFYDRLMNAIPQ